MLLSNTGIFNLLIPFLGLLIYLAIIWLIVRAIIRNNRLKKHKLELLEEQNELLRKIADKNL